MTHKNISITGLYSIERRTLIEIPNPSSVSVEVRSFLLRWDERLWPEPVSPLRTEMHAEKLSHLTPASFSPVVRTGNEGRLTTHSHVSLFMKLAKTPCSSSIVVVSSSFAIYIMRTT